MHKMLLLLLFFLPLAHGGVEIWSVTVMHVVSIIIFAFWVFSLIRNGHIKLYRTPLDIPLLFFIIYLIVSLSFSIYPYATRIQLYRIINYIGIFYFLINILRDENIISHREVKDNENSRGILPRLSGKMPDLFSFHVLRDKYVFSSQTLVLFTSYLAVLGALYGIAGLLFNTGNFLDLFI